MEKNKLRIFTGEAWIGDKFCPVTFIKAKDCDFKKENYPKMLQVDNPAMMVVSEICEVYMRHNVGYSNVWEANGFWEAVPEGTRGASLFYYARTKYADTAGATP